MNFEKIESNIELWNQKLGDIANKKNIHSILIMESKPNSMQVVASNSNPVYSVGDEGPKSNQQGCHELYCERVVNTKKELLVSDAKNDPTWSGNEDLVKFNLGVYYGLPLFKGDEVVGTICALNNTPYDFSHAEDNSPSLKTILNELKEEIEHNYL